MGNSEAFEEYKKLAGNLRFLDLEALKSQEQERKAFFINLYNVQMIHALVAQENLPDKPLSVQVMIYFNYSAIFSQNKRCFQARS